jgi:SOS-response transcriptional repressor LexA
MIGTSTKRRKYSKSPGKVLAFFVLFYKQNGISPTLRQISRGTGVASTSQIAGILRELHNEGHLIQIRRGNKSNYLPAEPAPDISDYLTEGMVQSVRKVSREMDIARA